jgi:hypothetical protein
VNAERFYKRSNGKPFIAVTVPQDSSMEATPYFFSSVRTTNLSGVGGRYDHHFVIQRG